MWPSVTRNRTQPVPYMKTYDGIWYGMVRNLKVFLFPIKLKAGNDQRKILCNNNVYFKLLSRPEDIKFFGVN